MARNISDQDEYLTDSQLCDLLHIDGRTSLRWRNEDKGPPFIRLGERRIVYSRADVDRWLAARRYKSRAAELAQLAAA